MSSRTLATYTENDLRGRLAEYEARFEKGSDAFFRRWESGELPHTDAFFDWAGLCMRLGIPARI
jgi:hypothetical protein